MSEKNGYYHGDYAISEMRECIELDRYSCIIFEPILKKGVNDEIRKLCGNNLLRNRYTTARDAAIFFGQDITKFPRRLRQR